MHLLRSHDRLGVSGLLLLLAATAPVPKLGAGEFASSQSLQQRVRAAVTRAVPYVEKHGIRWIEQKKCVSCHRVGTMVWSLGAARARGIQVSDELETWFSWSLEKSLAKNDAGTLVGSANKEGVAQLLLARNYFSADDQRLKGYLGLSQMIQNDQQPDGSWNPGGQLPFQKRPKQETAAVSTAWLALVLTEELDPDGAAKEGTPTAEEAISKAVAKLATATAPASTESLAVQLLLGAARKERDVVRQMTRKLRDSQRSDGGWGWLTEDPSDALATGLNLFALARAGAEDREMLRRAVDFLLNSQAADGTWSVKGTKAKGRGRVQETATYWGTTWAVIGLCELLPLSDAPQQPVVTDHGTDR